MRPADIFKSIIIVSLVILIVLLSSLATGCSEKSISGSAIQLSTTLVPAVDLDMYIYANQTIPTSFPGSLTGASSDFSVQSLALWGNVNDQNKYEIGGALALTSVSEAEMVYSLIKTQNRIYTRLSDKVVYFAVSSDDTIESIKTAIENNNFKKYDDENALAEVSRLPSGEQTIPGIIAVIKPNRGLVSLAEYYLDSYTASTLEVLYNNAKPGIIVMGIFSNQPVDLVDLTRRITDNTLKEINLGAVISMKSDYSSLVFSPIASQTLKSQGYPEVIVDDIQYYKTKVDITGGSNLPVYLNISGERVFAIASENENYTRSLMTGIKR